MIFKVFASVCPKVALKMHTSHGVWLFWLVFVLVCVCGVVFVVLPPFSACSAPMLLARSLGKCLLLVCLAFSCFLVGSLWAILLGILTCQTPCVICMDFIRVGHGSRAPNFPKRFPHHILHAQPPFQNNENLHFLCLGVGAYESVSFWQGVCIRMCLFQKIHVGKSCSCCFCSFEKFCIVVNFA